MTARATISALSCVIALCGTLARPSTARAAPLVSGFGGPAGFGSGILAPNDDGSSMMAIDLTGAFSGGLRFFGGPYSQFWVNNNGNITFSGPVSDYTPMPFPIADRPMIAPYWADIDTRNRMDLASPDENLVYWHLEPGRLVVTWYRVGYFLRHNDLRMSFQLIITNATDCGSGDFDVEFRYDRCEWTTGDDADLLDDVPGGMGGFGGTPAQAGFDAGDRMNFVALPGSFTREVLNLCTTSNVGTPGVWQFSVRSGGVICPEDMPCDVPDAQGPCAVGRTQCVGGGTAIECQPITTASAERCDGVDNDCDGELDDGADLCAAELTCVEGVCVPRCFEGGCETGFTCDGERCIETSCVDVDCEIGQRCEGGDCVEACEGIVCPRGQECILGSCVDPCDAVSCDSTQTCRDGLCVPMCPCVPCPAGESCLADGTCAPRGCDIVLCDEGFYCEDGRCHDACEGVVCPARQMCSLGECVAIPPLPDAGPRQTDGGTSGSGAVDAGTDAGPRGIDAGGTPPAGPGSSGSCGCRAGSHGSTPVWLAVAGLALAIGSRTRRAVRARR